MSINESQDGNTDDLIVETCNTNPGVDLAVEDIERSHRLGRKSLQDVAVDRNSLGKCLKSRPIIVKFLSYRKRQGIFSAEKKLKGQKLAIVLSHENKAENIQSCKRDCWLEKFSDPV